MFPPLPCKDAVAGSLRAMDSPKWLLSFRSKTMPVQRNIQVNQSQIWTPRCPERLCQPCGPRATLRAKEVARCPGIVKSESPNFETGPYICLTTFIQMSPEVGFPGIAAFSDWTVRQKCVDQEAVGDREPETFLHLFIYLFWSHLQNAEIPRPMIKPMSQQWFKPQ